MKIQSLDIYYNKYSPSFTSSGVKNLSHYGGSYEQWKAADDDKFIRTDIKPVYTEFDYLVKKAVFENLPVSKQKILNDFLELPGYFPDSLMYLDKKKNGELKYLLNLAGSSDMLGRLRIPADTIGIYANIPIEELEKIESVLLSKNDMGLWNYESDRVNDLLKLDDKQLWFLKKMAECHVEASNILDILQNRNLDWGKTLEKAESLNKLYGDDLREISFYSNLNGDNFISADIQLPHRSDKPDWLNFKRVYSNIDENVNPVTLKNSKADIDIYIDEIYKKIQKQLCVFDEKKLNEVINNIKKELQNVSEQEILSVMQRLTQFANYSSLTPLSEQLKQHNITSVIDEGEPNIYFRYFNHVKGILPLDITENGKFAYFVTKDSLNNPIELENIKKYINDDNVIFFNPDGWSDGVNIFRDDEKLEQLCKKILVSAKKINEKNPDMTFDEAISQSLNDSVSNKMKKLGADIITLRLKNPATKTQILEQMKPPMPSKGLIKSTIESVADYYTTKEKTFTDLCARIAKYYDENINAFSKQSIVEGLKCMHSKIYNYLQTHNLSKDNVYFVLPEIFGTHKSYEVITKMYTDLFNIPEEKIIRDFNTADVEDYPEGTTFVVLDDVVASGESMLMTGEYLFNAMDIPENRHILFAPLTASNTGIKYIKNIIQANGRAEFDDILFVNSKDYKDTKKLFIDSDKDNKFAAEAFGEEGYGKSGMCTVFPYMDPDNNSSLAGYLTKFFVPDSECLKSKTDLIPVIEEKTYYYDIFGSDKNHVEGIEKKKDNFLSSFLSYFKK